MQRTVEHSLDIFYKSDQRDNLATKKHNIVSIL